jgi:type VI protein secretion system component VasK
MTKVPVTTKPADKHKNTQVHRRRKTIRLLTPYVALLLVGFAAGYYAANQSHAGNTQSNRAERDDDTRQQEASNQRQIEKISQVEQTIQRDLDAGRIDQEKAQKAKDKLSEIKSYLESEEAKPSNRIDRMHTGKRSEWRQWAEQNGVPVEYFNRIN